MMNRKEKEPINADFKNILILSKLLFSIRAKDDSRRIVPKMVYTVKKIPINIAAIVVKVPSLFFIKLKRKWLFLKGLTITFSPIPDSCSSAVFIKIKKHINQKIHNNQGFSIILEIFNFNIFTPYTIIISQK